MTRTDVHVAPRDGRWSFRVNGVDFGPWPQCRAVKMALRTARALSTLPGVTARVVVHEEDGAVRSVLSFGGGAPMRLHRRRRAAETEARLPVALLARFSRDLARPPG